MGDGNEREREIAERLDDMTYGRLMGLVDRKETSAIYERLTALLAALHEARARNESLELANEQLIVQRDAAWKAHDEARDALDAAETELAVRTHQVAWLTEQRDAAVRALRAMLQHHSPHCCQPLDGECAHDLARRTLTPDK